MRAVALALVTAIGCSSDTTPPGAADGRGLYYTESVTTCDGFCPVENCTRYAWRLRLAGFFDVSAEPEPVTLRCDPR